ncbi:MAG: LLM class flavin-dependent oxidoreductase [Anaerolineae bacterium]|nr:LLM class flavin-dependent oxidoreductase [Anaerolineae bacterium]
MQRKMRYGIYLPNFGYFGDARTVANLARDAEQAGWDGFFIWDHVNLGAWVGTGLPFVDPWIALAAAATQTERIRLGALITPLPRRRPWKVARETVSLDHLSGGRLVFGVGIGIGPDEWDYLGEETDLKVRGAMLDEALTVLNGLWSGEPFSYDGAHYHVAETTFIPAPIQQPRIPVWVAAFSQNKGPLQRAARWDGIFPLAQDGQGDEFEQLRRMVGYTLEQRTTSTPFDIVYLGHSTPGDDPAWAAEIVAPLADIGFTWWLENLSIRREGPEHAAKWTFERLRERVLQGPPKL